MTRPFDWIQLGCLACMACLGLGRALLLHRRGVRIVAIDRQRTPGQMARDLLLIVGFLLWGGATIVYAWPLSVDMVPPPLDMVLIDALPARVLGAVMMVAGVVLYGLALAAFGHSWRMGIDRKSPGALVTHGIFAWTRNPIYLSLDLLVLGTFLIQGRLLFLGLSLLIAALLHDQIRREERFLAEAYGDAYRDYRARVGRYLFRTTKEGMRWN